MSNGLSTKDIVIGTTASGVVSGVCGAAYSAFVTVVYGNLESKKPQVAFDFESIAEYASHHAAMPMIGTALIAGASGLAYGCYKFATSTDDDGKILGSKLASRFGTLALNTAFFLNSFEYRDTKNAQIQSLKDELAKAKQETAVSSKQSLQNNKGSSITLKF